MSAPAVPAPASSITPAPLGRHERDLPFYAGVPTSISTTRWLVVVAACAAAFAQLVALPLPVAPAIGIWIHSVAFAVIPLLALAWAAPRGWTAIFRRVGVKDHRAMVGFAALNLVVSAAIGLVVRATVGAASNPINATLAAESAGERLNRLLPTLPQLLGEELITILPLLAILSILVRRGWSRRSALIVAVAATAVIFGALHLPTYDWNVIQCFAVIGVARLILTAAYLRTRNIWVSTGAHVIGDWVMFLLPLATGALLVA